MKSADGHDSLLFMTVLSYPIRHTVISCCCGWVGGETFACPHVQRSGSPQDLPAGLDSSVTSAHVFSQPGGSDSLLLLRALQENVMTSQDRDINKTLPACHIRSCLHLVEVNLLYYHILLSLPALIFWAVVAEDTDTHCEFIHLDSLFILRLKSGSWISLAQARGHAEKPVIMCFNAQPCKNSQGEGWGPDKTKKEWTFKTNACCPH